VFSTIDSWVGLRVPGLGVVAMFVFITLVGFLASNFLTRRLMALFEGVLEGTVSREILHDARWPIALLLSATGVSVYYLLVLRADQRAQPPSAARLVRFRDVVLVSSDEGGVLARRLEERLGTRVRVWRRSGQPPAGALTENEIADILARAESVSGERLLVIAVPGSSMVIPYVAG